MMTNDTVVLDLWMPDWQRKNTPTLNRKIKLSWIYEMVRCYSDRHQGGKAFLVRVRHPKTGEEKDWRVVDEKEYKRINHLWKNSWT